MRLLCCPDCGGNLGPELDCRRCGRTLAVGSDGVIDARPNIGQGSRSVGDHNGEQDHAYEIVQFEQKFHDEQAAYYDAVHTNPLPFRKYFERLIGQQIYSGLRNCSVVVDLCCGTGKSSIPLLERGKTVVGIDISREMLRRFRRKCPGKDVILVQADCSAPPLRVGACEAILLIGGLHHIPRREATLQRCADALKEGGLLIVHEPLQIGCSHWLATTLTNMYALSSPSRVWRAVARRIGLKPREANVEGTAPGPLFTPYEKPFHSLDELTGMLPKSMEIVMVRAQCALSGREFPRHMQHRLAEPLASAIVAADYWLSDAGKASGGDVILGFFRRASS